MGHKPFVQERPSHRPARFAERVKEELVDLIPGRLRDPRLQSLGMITFTRVEITPDLKHSVVMFSLLGEEARASEVEAALNQAAGFLRRELMHRLNTKITPTLLFRYDKGIEASTRVESLLKDITGGSKQGSGE